MIFATEAELCEAFVETLPKGWTPYNETAGFDILLVHETGFQIGVEAKKKINPKVILQAVEGLNGGRSCGPDARAILVESISGQTAAELAVIAALLQITVIGVSPKRRQASPWNSNSSKNWRSSPALPKAQAIKPKLSGSYYFYDRSDWFDLAPEERCILPEYVPDVPAGVPSPVILGEWKIQAIKLCIWISRHGVVTRTDFRKLNVSPSRWMDGFWLKKGNRRGDWVPGPNFPMNQFKTMHPEVFAKIEGDYDKWSVASGLVLGASQ